PWRFQLCEGEFSMLWRHSRPTQAWALTCGRRAPRLTFWPSSEDMKSWNLALISGWVRMAFSTIWGSWSAAWADTAPAADRAPLRKSRCITRFRRMGIPYYYYFSRTVLLLNRTCRLSHRLRTRIPR